ncbi:MAG: ATP-utilizing protein [Pirellulaceae bacterium]|nr:MAG: ATP-utilizing protein [Pirellulaceae bacterium]
MSTTVSEHSGDLYRSAACSAATQAARLIHWFRPADRYVIALSGGVDSAVVAKAAVEAGVAPIACTAAGPALSAREREDASRLACQIGIAHQWIDAGEIRAAEYRRNGPDRCFACKSRLYQAMQDRFPEAILVNGTNADDLDDYRPGLQAAREYGVRSPLVELGFSKRDVRMLAAHWQLVVAEKPASPCLASRIAHGVEVTPQRLQQIDSAEMVIRQVLGIDDCRVRLHPGNMARIELPERAFYLLASEDTRQTILRRLKELGFLFVTLDLEGQRSGSLNQLLHLPIAAP